MANARRLVPKRPDVHNGFYSERDRQPEWHRPRSEPPTPYQHISQQLDQPHGLRVAPPRPANPVVRDELRKGVRELPTSQKMLYKVDTPATNQLHVRAKQAMLDLCQQEGLGALVHLILINAASACCPPTIYHGFLQRWISEVIGQLKDIGINVQPPTAARVQLCLGLIPAREPAASYLHGLLCFLLSQGKAFAQPVQTRNRFEFLINSLLLQCDSDLRMLRGTRNDVGHDGGPHCFLLRQHDSGAYISKPKRVAVCAFNTQEEVQWRPDSAMSWMATEAPLGGLEHEMKSVFDNLEKNGVEIIYAQSWEELLRFRNVDVVYMAGHTDGRNSDGLPVLTLGQDSKVTAEAAEALCRSGAPQLVVLNGCNSILHASALLGKGVGHVLCWENEVKDSEAVVFGADFVNELTKHDRVRILDALKSVTGVFTAWDCPAEALFAAATEDPDTKRRRIELANDEELAIALQHEEDDCAATQLQKEEDANVARNHHMMPRPLHQISTTSRNSTSGSHAPPPCALM